MVAVMYLLLKRNWFDTPVWFVVWLSLLIVLSALALAGLLTLTVRWTRLSPRQRWELFVASLLI